MKDVHTIFPQTNAQPNMQQDYYTKTNDQKNNPIHKKVNQLLMIQPPAPKVICRITEKNGQTHTGYIQAKSQTTITINNRFHEQIIPIDAVEQIQPISFQQ